MLRKDKLNTIEALISRTLIDSYISHDEFVSVNNALREYNEMKEEIKKSWNFCRTHYISMVDISRETYERNGIETIVDNDGILWLNEKYIEEELEEHKNLREITIKYNSDHRKRRYEIVNEPKKNAIEFLLRKNWQSK